MSGKLQMDALQAKVDIDEFIDANGKVKAAACALLSLWENDAGGEIVYTGDLLNVLARQLHEAAAYFDGVIENK